MHVLAELPFHIRICTRLYLPNMEMPDTRFGAAPNFCSIYGYVPECTYPIWRCRACGSALRRTSVPYTDICVLMITQYGDAGHVVRRCAELLFHKRIYVYSWLPNMEMSGTRFGAAPNYPSINGYIRARTYLIWRSQAHDLAFIVSDHHATWSALRRPLHMYVINHFIHTLPSQSPNIQIQVTHI